MFFSPSQSSDIRAVINSIVENKVKIQQLNEDNKEAIKGLVEKFEGALDKTELNNWIKWSLAPEKRHEDQEKIEESAAKFDDIMQGKNKYQMHDTRELNLTDLD